MEGQEGLPASYPELDWTSAGASVETREVGGGQVWTCGNIGQEMLVLRRECGLDQLLMRSRPLRGQTECGELMITGAKEHSQREPENRGVKGGSGQSSHKKRISRPKAYLTVVTIGEKARG